VDEIEEYIKAGKIAAKARDAGRKLVKPGESVLKIAEKIEQMIKEEGAGIAFPANISINENAAHYTPKHADDLVIKENDVVKVDVGTHINGFIGDTAITVDVSGEHSDLIEAGEQALENALAIAKAGVEVGKIGEEIEKTIISKGFRPVENLSGHSLGQYSLHSGVSIPNVKQEKTEKLEEGMAVAIEPFASTGKGIVTEGNITEIFQLQAVVPVRNTHARKLIQVIAQEYKTLPFAERWLYSKGFNEFQIKVGLKELVQAGALRPYPVLHDIKGSLVSQKEHTIIIEKDSCKITTR